MEVFTPSDLENLPPRARRGIVLGRFQPFHKGHFAIMNKALEHCENLSVIIGCTHNKCDPRNPLDFPMRCAAITKWMAGCVEIFPLYDKPTDEEWLADFFVLFPEQGEYLIFTGSLDDVEFFKDLNLPGFALVVVDRFSEGLKAYSGTRIRELQSQNNPLWRTMIP